MQDGDELLEEVPKLLQLVAPQQLLFVHHSSEELFEGSRLSGMGELVETSLEAQEDSVSQLMAIVLKKQLVETDSLIEELPQKVD